jgi:chromosome segregation ATPase
MSTTVTGDKLRSTLDLEDLTDCRTVGTGVGIVSSGLTVGIGVCTGNIPMIAMGALSYFSGSMGHQHARDSTKNFDSALTWSVAYEKLSEQMKQKEALIKEQKGEIEKFQQVNSALQEKMQLLERTQKSFDTLNEEQLSILQQQQEEIENRSCFLSKLSGMVERYEQRKEKLREEIQQAREERERLQQEIQSLLEQQRELNAQLASAIGSLSAVVDKMKQEGESS